VLRESSPSVATSVSRRSIVLRHLHRRRHSEGVGLSDSYERPCFHDLS
jgi:hypothetical protein